MSKERPILFSGAMVRALLAGTKTQTRRAVKAKHLPWLENSVLNFLDGKWNQRPLPYGQPGDRLWVRETWMDLQGTGIEVVTGSTARYAYGADTPRGSYGDDQRKCYGLKWRPSIHMPRAVSRITLEITSVRAERLQDISEADALAEGIVRQPDGGYGLADTTHYHFTDPRQSYFSLWEAINGEENVAANPWVWVVEFRMLP